MVDVSLGGAQVSVPGPGLPLGTETLLAMWVPDRAEPIIFEVTVCSRQEDRHRLEFRVRDWRALAALSATAMGVGAPTWATDAAQGHLIARPTTDHDQLSRWTTR
jgi:cellulose synthase (UDP-forming)